MKTILIICLGFGLISYLGYSQKSKVKIGDNPYTLNASAALEIESTTKGFLPPRMTQNEMNAIPTPATGLQVYCTTCSPAGLYNFNGTVWGSLVTTNFSTDITVNGATVGTGNNNIADNTALGVSALKSVGINTLYTLNTAIGSNSLSKMIGGSNNTAIGANAGKNITLGEGNIFIGGTEIPDDLGFTIGNYNTIIGSNINGIGLNNYLESNIILADGRGQIRAWHDNTQWDLGNVKANFTTDSSGATQSAGDNSTKLATTAFVNTAINTAILPAISLTISASQPVRNLSGSSVLKCDSSEFTNVNGLSSSGVYGFKAPKSGFYLITGQISLSGCTTTKIQSVLWKNINTTTNPINSVNGNFTGTIPTSLKRGTAGGNSNVSTLSCLVKLVVNDTLTFGANIEFSTCTSVIFPINSGDNYFQVQYVSAY